MLKSEFPSAAEGMRIGLLGGSFNPPHAGHLHISKMALKRFGLDQVWWLVSPGNPLKADAPVAMDLRLAACREMADHPRIQVTDFEARVGTRYTAETISALFRQYPKVRFTWLMGADNLAEFHRWQDWQWIMENIPVGVLARPRGTTGGRMAARTSVAAKVYEDYRLRGASSTQLATARPPAWCLVNLPMVQVSSTAIRKRTGWGG